jgi:hypothetical protein
MIERGHVNAPSYGWAFLQSAIEQANEQKT